MFSLSLLLLQLIARLVFLVFERFYLGICCNKRKLVPTRYKHISPETCYSTTYYRPHVEVPWKIHTIEERAANTLWQNTYVDSANMHRSTIAQW